MLTKDEKEIVKSIKTALDELISVEYSDNEIKEEVFDHELGKIRNMATLPNIFNLVVIAVGKSKKRAKVSGYAFSELFDIEGVDRIFADLLASADDSARSSIIQTIGLRNLVNFVPILEKHFETENDQFCRDQLLHVLATFHQESSFPIFMHLAARDYSDSRWRVVWAFSNYGKKECIPYLAKVFNDVNSENSIKTIAASGLVKAGEHKYYDFLIEMLYDKPIKTSKSYDPGGSLRAAQELNKIHSWGFESGDIVTNVRNRIPRKTSLFRRCLNLLRNQQ